MLQSLSNEHFAVNRSYQLWIDLDTISMGKHWLDAIMYITQINYRYLIINRNFDCRSVNQWKATWQIIVVWLLSQIDKSTLLHYLNKLLKIKTGAVRAKLISLRVSLKTILCAIVKSLGLLLRTVWLRNNKGISRLLVFIQCNFQK